MADDRTVATRVGRKPLIICPVLSGLLLWWSFWLPGLVWIALTPLGLLVRMQGDRRWVYLGAWLGGITFFLPGTFWVRLCDASAWPGWLALALYLGAYFPAVVLVTRVWNRRWNLPLIVALPAAWVAHEYVRMHALSGFGWLMLAHSIYEWPRTIQIADFSGVYGVSFVIATVNAVIVELFTLPLRVPAVTGMRWNPALLWRIAVAFALVLGTHIYGIVRLSQADFQPGPTVVMLHTNIEQRLKMSGDNKVHEKIYKDLRTWTVEKAGSVQADLVVWPETMYPYLYGDIDPTVGDEQVDRVRLKRLHPRGGEGVDPPSESIGKAIRAEMAASRQALQKMAEATAKPLLFGTSRHVFQPGRLAVYNSSVLMAPQKGEVAYYDKLHLVPFGEYLPLKDMLTFLRWLVPYDADAFGIDAATEYRTIHYDKLNFAVLICFEDTVPHLAREFLRSRQETEPIEFFVNQSNDGWFEGSIEPDYHLAASIFRCVECRLPMVRVTNLGVTALVDANGVVQVTVPADRRSAPGMIRETVPLDDRSAAYIVLGDWVGQLCLGGAVLGLLMSVVRIAWLAWRRLSGQSRVLSVGLG